MLAMIETATFRMADRLAGGNLAETIRTYRDEGLSSDDISRRLFAELGVEVTGRTIGRWLPTLMASGNAEPQDAA